MKKLKIKTLACLLGKSIGMLKRAVTSKFRPPVRVKLTRQNLIITLPASHGGDLHIFPRQGSRLSFFVDQDESQYALRTLPDHTTLALYSSPQEAYRALGILNKALTGFSIGKWVFRLVLLWLIWLFATSYMEVTKRSAPPENVLGYESFTPNIQTDPPQYQAIPSATGPNGGDLSEYIYQQAMLAKDKAEKDALPPKTGTTGGSDGLAGFGLKAVNSEGTGVGCDPKLAFKVPK